MLNRSSFTRHGKGCAVSAPPSRVRRVLKRGRHSFTDQSDSSPSKDGSQVVTLSKDSTKLSNKLRPVSIPHLNGLVMKKHAKSNLALSAGHHRALPSRPSPGAPQWLQPRKEEAHTLPLRFEVAHRTGSSSIVDPGEDHAVLCPPQRHHSSCDAISRWRS